MNQTTMDPAPVGPGPTTGGRRMEYFVHVGGERLRIERKGGELRVDGEVVEADLAPAAGSPIRSLRLGGRSLRVLPRRNGRGNWELEVEGVRWSAEVMDRGQEAIRAARKAAGHGSGPQPLRAPMPGLVVRVEVAVGDEVAAGQGVAIVEAMKMENELKAPAPARVKAIHCREGMAVEKDTVLVEFEALDEGEDNG
jgi:biotin carboxyl carrier protein